LWRRSGGSGHKPHRLRRPVRSALIALLGGAAAIPGLEKVAVLKAANDPNSIYAMKSLEPWGHQLRVELWPIEVEAAQGLDRAFLEISGNQIKALLIIGGALIFANRKRIAELALQHRLASCGNFRETVELGGLASISPSFS